MKKMYDLYAAYMSVQDVSLRNFGFTSDEEIPFRISIVDGVIRKFEEIILGHSQFKIKNYDASDDVGSWIKMLDDNGGASDDRSFIYEMEFPYGATYLYDLLDHVMKHTPLSKAWKMESGELTVDGEGMLLEDDVDESISNLAECFGHRFTKDQAVNLRTILAKGGYGIGDEAFDYAKSVCDRAALFDRFIPLSEDLGSEELSPEYEKLCKTLVDSIYADFYPEDLGDEILGISNKAIPQYHRWREQGASLRKEDKVAVRMLEHALNSLKFSSAETSEHYCGKLADFWYNHYSPSQYSTYSLASTPIHEVLGVYVIDICLMHLDEQYHFVEGGVEQWAA